MVQDLEESDIVLYVSVSNAATKDQNVNADAQSGQPENVITTMTIYFTSPQGEDTTQEEDGSTSANPLADAMDNVAQGTASDLAQTDVEGGAE